MLSLLPTLRTDRLLIPSSLGVRVGTQQAAIAFQGLSSDVRIKQRMRD